MNYATMDHPWRLIYHVKPGNYTLIAVNQQENAPEWPFCHGFSMGSWRRRLWTKVSVIIHFLFISIVTTLLSKVLTCGGQLRAHEGNKFMWIITVCSCVAPSSSGCSLNGAASLLLFHYHLSSLFVVVSYQFIWLMHFSKVGASRCWIYMLVLSNFSCHILLGLAFHSTKFNRLNDWIAQLLKKLTENFAD